MLRINIYIPEDLNRRLDLAAKSTYKAKAEIIRQALEKGISAVQQQGTASVQVLLKIIELGKKYRVKGPKDAVENFDEYLYGRDWSKK